MCTSALGPFVGLLRNGRIYACAELTEVDPKTVKAILNWNNVNGEITLTQKSPFDATSLHIHFEVIDNDVGIGLRILV